MENDIISVYLNRKKTNISEYACIFAKYALNNNLKLNKIIYKIVEIYIDKYYMQKNLDFDLLNKYFESKPGSESTIKDVLMSSIMFYKNSGLENNISNEINTIVILSNLIFLAISLDETIDEYNYGEIELDDRVELFISKFKSKLKIKDEDFDNFINEIKNITKKDCNAFKKFWRLIDNSNYNLELHQTVKNDNLYFVKCSYDIKLLNRYDKKEVKRISLTKGIIDDINTIYLEQLSILILKNLIKKHFDDRFFIDIDLDYFSKNKNIVSLDRLYNNNCTKRCLVFIFDYKTYKENKNIISELHSKGYLVGLKNIPDETNLNMSMFDIFDYIFISSKLLDRYKNFEEVWNMKNINFIIDNESYIKIEEKNLLSRKR